ncbi:hypothetical protein B0H10DRAFT_2192870 [Mycena sp. CBHHK59/15]|nr:hypothetical protein B0H10DRAFT_2192870 [Mycena sp. CBHHK59/15]
MSSTAAGKGSHPDSTYLSLPKRSSLAAFQSIRTVRMTGKVKRKEELEVESEKRHVPSGWISKIGMSSPEKTGADAKTKSGLDRSSRQVEVKSKKGSMIEQRTMVNGQWSTRCGDQIKSSSHYYRDISYFLSSSMPPHRTSAAPPPHHLIIAPVSSMSHSTHSPPFLSKRHGAWWLWHLRISAKHHQFCHPHLMTRPAASLQVSREQGVRGGYQHQQSPLCGPISNTKSTEQNNGKQDWPRHLASKLKLYWDSILYVSNLSHKKLEAGQGLCRRIKFNSWMWMSAVRETICAQMASQGTQQCAPAYVIATSCDADKAISKKGSK